jgi:RNA polymerase sigma-70 factor (ECF subfamily)
LDKVVAQKTWGTNIFAVEDNHTTAVVQRYLNDLADLRGDTPAESVVRGLLGSAVDRLHGLCSSLLYRSYPRLARPPLNLQADELLSSVVERMLKAMREVRPQTVRQFFALANQHMRWELNDLARRLDHQAAAVELRDSMVPPAPDDGESDLSVDARRILAAIDQLPDEEREVFNLVRVQGLSHPEAAAVLEVSPKTVQRRLNRSRVLLAAQLADLGPTETGGRNRRMNREDLDG